MFECGGDATKGHRQERRGQQIGMFRFDPSSGLRSIQEWLKCHVDPTRKSRKRVTYVQALVGKARNGPLDFADAAREVHRFMNARRL